MQRTNRQAYLDWLRIFSIAGVLVFHSGMAYVSEWDWHIKNSETSNLLLEFNFWLHNFRMPLLFFISGTVSFFMMQTRTGSGFVGLRFRRLFIPLVAGMLIVVPPQVYMERLTQGFKGNFWDFYPSIFKGIPYPKGNLSWHHLWFILYLFLYDIMLAPVFAWMISSRGRKTMESLGWLAGGKRIYLLVIPSVVLYAALSRKFPETNDLVHDWCYFIYWMLFVLAGYVAMASPRLTESLERNRRFSLAAAFCTIVAINYIRWNSIEPWNVIANWKNDWRTYAYIALSAWNAWAWVFTAIGYGKKYLNRKLPVLNYLNQAVYPFYILHQTVIVIIVFYVVRTSDTIGMKYLFTILTAFFVTSCIYHLFIRPFSLMRLLFGMKPRKLGNEAVRSGALEREKVPEVKEGASVELSASGAVLNIKFTS